MEIQFAYLTFQEIKREREIIAASISMAILTSMLINPICSNLGQKSNFEVSLMCVLLFIFVFPFLPLLFLVPKLISHAQLIIIWVFPDSKITKKHDNEESL